MIQPTLPRIIEPKGLIQVYTGDGKGKTTAALGMAVRAVGAGLKVAIVYFDKGGTHYSERKVLEEKFKGEIDFFPTGLDRIDPKTGRFRFGVTDEDVAEGLRGLEIARALLSSGEHDLVVLDEVNTSTSLGIIDEVAVLEILGAKPPHVEVVCTGRQCPEAIREKADLVSETGIGKHYFYSGVQAREGFDW